MRYAKGLGKSPTPKTIQGRIAGKLRPGALLIHLVNVAGLLWERDSLGLWRRQLNQNPHSKCELNRRKVLSSTKGGAGQVMMTVGHRKTGGVYGFSG
jgi:hypothetical protein